MKKIALLTILIMSLALCACQEKDDNKDTSDKNTSTSAPQEKEEFESLLQLYNDLTAEIEFSPMFEVSSEYALNLFGIDTTVLLDNVIYISEDVMSPDTVIIVETATKEDLESVEELLNGYVESKLTELEDYNPDNYEIVKNCEVITSGNYVYLVISKNSKDANDFLEKYI